MSRVEIYKQGWDFLRRLLGEPLDEKEQLLVAGVNELFNKITASDTLLDEASDKASDKAANEALDKATDTSLDEASDKASDKALDKASDKATDKASDKASGTLHVSDPSYSDLEPLTEIDMTLSTQLNPGETLDNFSSLEISAVSVLETLSQSVGPGHEFTVRVVEHKSLANTFNQSPFLIVKDVPAPLPKQYVFKELSFQTIPEHGIGLRYIGTKPIKKYTFVLAAKGRYVTQAEARRIPDSRYLIEEDGKNFLFDEKFSAENACLMINHATDKQRNCGFWFRFHDYKHKTIPPHSICVDKHHKLYVDLGYPFFAERFPLDMASHQPMVYAFALRDIKPGENLYVDYGEEFWNEQ